MADEQKEKPQEPDRTADDDWDAPELEIEPVDIMEKAEGPSDENE